MGSVGAVTSSSAAAGSLAVHERRALADLLGELGPDAPTCCEGWTTAHLAAHLVVRDRRPDAMPGYALEMVPRLARPPLPEGLVSRPLRRRPTREVHAAWRRSAGASPAVRAVLAELAVQP